MLHARAADLIPQAAVVALHVELGPETGSVAPAAAVEIADKSVLADLEPDWKECGRRAL